MTCPSRKLCINSYIYQYIITYAIKTFYHSVGRTKTILLIKLPNEAWFPDHRYIEITLFLGGIILWPVRETDPMILCLIFIFMPLSLMISSTIIPFYSILALRYMTFLPISLTLCSFSQVSLLFG